MSPGRRLQLFAMAAAVASLGAALWWVADAPLPSATKSPVINETTRFGLELVAGRIEWLMAIAVAMIGATGAIALKLTSAADLSSGETAAVLLALLYCATSVYFGLEVSTELYSRLAKSYIPNIYAEATRRQFGFQHWFLFGGTAIVAMVVARRLWRGATREVN